MDRLYQLKHSPMAIEKVKIALQYGLMTVSALVAGATFTFLLQEAAFLSFFYSVFAHFGESFLGIQSLGEASILLLKYSASDMIGAVLLLVFSFSVLNYLASELVLIFEGFKVGFGTCMLVRLLSAKSLRAYIATHLCLAYVAVSWILLICCLVYAWRLAERSLPLRRWDPTGRSMLQVSHILPLLLCFLKYCGWILLFNLLYCLIIFLL